MSRDFNDGYMWNCRFGSMVESLLISTRWWIKTSPWGLLGDMWSEIEKEVAFSSETTLSTSSILQAWFCKSCCFHHPNVFNCCYSFSTHSLWPTTFSYFISDSCSFKAQPLDHWVQLVFFDTSKTNTIQMNQLVGFT